MSNTFWKSFSVLVTVLFEDEEEKSKQSMFNEACKNDDIDTVIFLLKYSEIKPTDFAFCKAIRNVEVLEILLQNGRSDPYVNENAVFRMACHKGNIAVVNRLLQDNRVDPSADNNYAIRIASENGYVEVVDRLLQDKRVDLYDVNNHAIRDASENGHIAVVDRLLQESTTCVEPYTFIKTAIHCSSYRGHADIVYLLLQDKRVDFYDNINLDIDWTIFSAMHYRYSDVVNLLLQYKARLVVKNLTVDHHDQN
jgi:ankyrin repeat protein